jgi:hypothetical protein
MQPDRRPDPDRSLESLESRLRALPRPPVPAELEARILAASSAKVPNPMPRPARAWRRRHLAVGAAASIAVAVACLLAVRFRPGLGVKITAPTFVANAEGNDSAHEATPQQPGHSPGTISWLKARQDPDGAEIPTFIWPIREKPPLMVSTSLRSDLLD